MSRRLLPGFRATTGFTAAYLALMVAVPIAACVTTAFRLSASEFWAAVWSPQAASAYILTVSAALIAALLCVPIGFVIAWVLVRYEFPGKRILDSLVDLPFALPTAVAGLVFANLYAKTGWFGQHLVPLGIEAAYSRLAIVWVLVFIGFPFVVRTVEPVLKALEAEGEEAAMSLGATRWQAFRRVVLPALGPALTSSFALALARGLGEYGSVVFVSGNIPYQTQIAPILVVERLEADRPSNYAEASAVAVVLLALSALTLAAAQLLEARSRRHVG